MGLAIRDPSSDGMLASGLHPCQHLGCDTALEFFKMSPWGEIRQRLQTNTKHLSLYYFLEIQANLQFSQK